MLERAILDAALEQLSTVGWNGLTMEGVAAGAQTGKAAVYRRWPSKEDLVVDALQAGLPHLDVAAGLRERPGGPPAAVQADAGGDVLAPRIRAALGASRMRLRVGRRFHGVIFEGVIEPSVGADQGGHAPRSRARRGACRGRRIAYVCDVIPAMMMYRSKVCGSEWRDEEFAEMIDQVMVPLFASR